MSIPIQNLYYLLSYAWETLEQADVVPVSSADVQTASDLFVRILEASTAHLIRRGLDREYVEVAEDTRCLRGKVNLAVTTKRNLPLKGELHVERDSLSHQVLHNRILKSTIRRVLRCSNVDRRLHDSLSRVYRYLDDIADVEISPRVFSHVHLHRNNSHYRLPLAVCRLIHDCQLIEEAPGKSVFRDFTRDEKGMATLFERFLFRFFQREQDFYRVSREQIAWREVEATSDDLQFLPGMRTDVSLESKTRKVIVDAKFHRDTFQTHFGRERVKSENLYQIYAYLRNQVTQSSPVEGLLLYPSTSGDVELDYRIHGFRIRIATVDLALPWRAVHNRLLSLVQ